MPQATDEMREAIRKRVNNLSNYTVNYWLESQGFTCDEKWVWHHPTKSWDDLSDDEREAILFLADEWDWGGFE